MRSTKKEVEGCTNCFLTPTLNNLFSRSGIRPLAMDPHTVADPNAPVSRDHVISVNPGKLPRSSILLLTNESYPPEGTQRGGIHFCNLTCTQRPLPFFSYEDSICRGWKMDNLSGDGARRC